MKSYYRKFGYNAFMFCCRLRTPKYLQQSGDLNHYKPKIWCCPSLPILWCCTNPQVNSFSHSGREKSQTQTYL